MYPVINIGKLTGKGTVFTFDNGNYLEDNVLGMLPNAIGGFLSKGKLISYGKGNGKGGYGTLELDPSSTKDRIVCSCADTCPGAILYGLTSLLRAVCIRGAGQFGPGGQHDTYALPVPDRGTPGCSRLLEGARELPLRP